MALTKVYCYHDEGSPPYLVKISKPVQSITLADLKSELNKPGKYNKYFFKSRDEDFGDVKEEINDDNGLLPVYDNKIICYLENNNETSSNVSVRRDKGEASLLLGERGYGVGQTRPPSFHGGPTSAALASPKNGDNHVGDSILPDDHIGADDAESSITSVSQAGMRRNSGHRLPRMDSRGLPRLPGPGIRPPNSGVSRHRRIHNNNNNNINEESVFSSDIDSSICDTEDGGSLASSRFTTSTNHTSVSQQALRNRQKRMSKKRGQMMQRARSISSFTESTMSLNTMTVTLQMDKVNFLGISIVGRGGYEDEGDMGIYIGTIMRGGAVALDGRIQPGDRVLQVNDISFEDKTNDEAVRILREVVQNPGPIKLVVAKCLDPSEASESYLPLQRAEPVRPIDPEAWVAHTAAVRGDYPMPTSHFTSPHPRTDEYGGRCVSVTTLSNSSLTTTSQAETERFIPPAPPLKLTSSSDPRLIAEAVRKPDSGLEIRDRLWLKMVIKNAFMGSELIEWLQKNVEGLEERKEARKMANLMLRSQLITHSVNKSAFSEQRYYTFGSISSTLERRQVTSGVANLRVNDEQQQQHGAVIEQQANRAMMPILPPLSNNCNASWSHEGSSYHQHDYGPLYSPGAPPPSSNYTHINYEAQPPVVNNDWPPINKSAASSGSGSGSRQLRLAGSGSGSESDARTISNVAMHQRPPMAPLYPNALGGPAVGPPGSILAPYTTNS